MKLGNINAHCDDEGVGTRIVIVNCSDEEYNLVFSDKNEKDVVIDTVLLDKNACVDPFDGCHRLKAVGVLGQDIEIPTILYHHLLGTTTFLPQRIHLDPAVVHLFVSTAIFLPQRNQLDPEASLAKLPIIY